MRVFWQRKRVAVMSAGLALVIAGLTWAQSARTAAPANPPVKLKVADNRGPAVTNRLGFAPVVKEVLPSVVSIQSSKMVRTSENPGRNRGQGQGQMDPF